MCVYVCVYVCVCVYVRVCFFSGTLTRDLRPPDIVIFGTAAQFKTVDFRHAVCDDSHSACTSKQNKLRITTVIERGKTSTHRHHSTITRASNIELCLLSWRYCRRNWRYVPIINPGIPPKAPNVNCTRPHFVILYYRHDLVAVRVGLDQHRHEVVTATIIFESKHLINLNSISPYWYLRGGVYAALRSTSILCL